MWPGPPGAVKPGRGFSAPKLGGSLGDAVAARTGAIAADDAVQGVVAHGDERAVPERAGQRAKGRDLAHSGEHIAVVFIDAARAHQAHPFDAPIGEHREFENHVTATALFDGPVGKRPLQLVIDTLLQARNVALDPGIVQGIGTWAKAARRRMRAHAFVTRSAGPPAVWLAADTRALRTSDGA